MSRGNGYPRYMAKCKRQGCSNQMSTTALYCFYHSSDSPAVRYKDPGIRAARRRYSQWKSKVINEGHIFDVDPTVYHKTLVGPCSSCGLVSDEDKEAGCGVALTDPSLGYTTGNIVRLCASCSKRPKELAYRVKKYGMTTEDFYARVKAQRGECSICKWVPVEPIDLVIDHCHKTGGVRGLLCNGCNSAIGMLGDTSAGLFLAYKYLLAFESKPE